MLETKLKAYKKLVRNMTLGDVEEAAACTLKMDGMSTGSMAPKVRALHESKRENAWAFRVRENGVLVGWALVWRKEKYEPESGPVNKWLKDDPDGPLQAYFYTQPKMRGKGIGRILVDAIVKEFGEAPEVFPWDKRSSAFFKEMGLPAAEGWYYL